MLRVENICVNLGDFGLDRISLHVEHGKYLVLLGPTGTGKTVLLETIAGLNRPTTGRIVINGEDVTHLEPEKRHLGVVYQDYALFPHLSVFDNIGFGLRLKGATKQQTRKSVEEMTDFLEIAHLLKRRPNRLSGGERQRVALARALVMKPYVLLLDEPLSALDRASRDRIQEELRRIHAELSVTIVHITHNLKEAFSLADRLAVMKDGRLLQEGPPETLFTSPRDRSVAELMGIENMIAATVLENTLVTAWGKIAMDRLLKCEIRPTGRVFLSVPSWCVELFPQKPAQEYLWQGRLKIAVSRRLGGAVALTLKQGNGQQLKTSLSIREAETAETPLDTGALVPVGIRARGVHWVPDEGPG